MQNAVPDDSSRHVKQKRVVSGVSHRLAMEDVDIIVFDPTYYELLSTGAIYIALKSVRS